MVLTRRAWHLRHHAGEVSFPGGRREPGDADLWATALREATEETGLDPGSVSRIGRLDSFVTVGSRSLVCPFVATAARRPDLVPDPVEVERVLHVRLAELTDPETWREEIWSLDAAFGVRAHHDVLRTPRRHCLGGDRGGTAQAPDCRDRRRVGSSGAWFLAREALPWLR